MPYGRAACDARYVARTHAVYYCDERGAEPVDRFTEDLPAKPAAKIDDFIEEYLNGKSPDAPPPEFPISSQIEGELRELRVRFANTRYRLLYQRSENLIVLLHAIEKEGESVPRVPLRWRNDGWLTSNAAWTRSGECRRVRLVKTLRQAAEEAVD